MFERFTEKARRVVFFARHEAAKAGSPSIAPEHLLLGILREKPRVVSILGLPDNFDAEFRAELPPSNKKIDTSTDLPLTQAAQRVLAYGAEETERSDGQIAPEHLLIGIMRESGTVAELALRKHGLSLDSGREKLAIRNEQILASLRSTFAPMAAGLALQTEPAVVYVLPSGAAK